MPRPISLLLQNQIVLLHNQEMSLQEIATVLQMPFSTVRAVWRRYDKSEQKTLPAPYQGCYKKELHHEELIRRAAVFLKRRHPSWGAGLVLVLLRERWANKKLPSTRTIQRWWQKAKVNCPKRKLPLLLKDWAKRVDEVWQVDATSHLRLLDSTAASWLTFSDEASGAVLEAVAFPPVDLGAC
jgi:transposase